MTAIPLPYLPPVSPPTIAWDVVLVIANVIVAAMAINTLNESTKDKSDSKPDSAKEDCPQSEEVKEKARELKERNGGKNRVETPEKRIDLDGKGHRDPVTGEKIETPHVHDAKPAHPEGSPGAGRHPGYEHVPRPATPKDLEDAAKALEAIGK